jgi:hypothetical protein
MLIEMKITDNKSKKLAISGSKSTHQGNTANGYQSEINNKTDSIKTKVNSYSSTKSNMRSLKEKKNIIKKKVKQ